MEDIDLLVFLGICCCSFFVAASISAFCGSQISTDQAQGVAQEQLSRAAEIESKDVWFVGIKGCDRRDNVLFRVKPYIGNNGLLVQNAIICGGWPFKGMTVRYK
jgi:hypothetical protein